MDMNYYNEFDPKPAAWLRELIKEGHIPNGEVDTRSIIDVRPSDLEGFNQCHFFAGVGGWALALQLAGWPEGLPVWTASCPCQPFSVAGKGLGTADERHLWPVFGELVRACKPSVAFGEQVASKDGREWLAGVFSDLERMGYQRAGADLCAAGVGAPHIRQRLYWVAHSSSSSSSSPGLEEWQEQSPWTEQPPIERSGDAGGMGNAGCECNEFGRRPGDVGCTSGQEQGKAQQREWRRDANSYTGSDDHRMGQPNSYRCKSGSPSTSAPGHRDSFEPTSFWVDSRLIECRDGKYRRIPTEPSLFPLAHGVPHRVATLRGAGNAIVPQVAAAFIEAYLEAV